MHRQIGRQVRSQLPASPLAELIQVIVRSYHLDSEQFRSDPRTCWPFCDCFGIFGWRFLSGCSPYCSSSRPKGLLGFETRRENRKRLTIASVPSGCPAGLPSRGIVAVVLTVPIGLR